MQPRFDKRSGSTPYSLVEQARFRAAFDFMRLRADVGEVSEAIAEWWQEFSTADEVRRQDLLDQVREEQHKGRRVHTRAPRREATAADADTAPASETASGEEAGESAGAAPRKRRRRRKPRTGAAGGADGGASTSQP